MRRYFHDKFYGIPRRVSVSDARFLLILGVIVGTAVNVLLSLAMHR